MTKTKGYFPRQVKTILYTVCIGSKFSHHLVPFLARNSGVTVAGGQWSLTTARCSRTPFASTPRDVFAHRRTHEELSPQIVPFKTHRLKVCFCKLEASLMMLAEEIAHRVAQVGSMTESCSATWPTCFWAALGVAFPGSGSMATWRCSLQPVFLAQSL